MAVSKKINNTKASVQGYSIGQLGGLFSDQKKDANSSGSSELNKYFQVTAVSDFSSAKKDTDKIGKKSKAVDNDGAASDKVEVIKGVTQLLTDDEQDDSDEEYLAQIGNDKRSSVKPAYNKLEPAADDEDEMSEEESGSDVVEEEENDDDGDSAGGKVSEPSSKQVEKEQSTEKDELTDKRNPDKKEENEKEKLTRTIFVGNIPIKSKKKNIKALFKDCGVIESIRFRSVPLDAPNKNRKIAVVKQEVHADRMSMNCYVVFDCRNSCKRAMKLNNKVHEGLTLRVDWADSKPEDTAQTVFVGALPFGIEDERVREFFQDCGSIEYVRVVRDRKTNVGKGIAYVKFTDKSAVGLALKLNGKEIEEGRKIRVVVAMSIEKMNKKKEKDQNSFQGTTSKKPLSGAMMRLEQKKLNGNQPVSNKRKASNKKKNTNGGKKTKKS